MTLSSPHHNTNADDDSRRVGASAGILFGLTGMGSAAVAVTVPGISETFDVGANAGSWVISTYAISLAVGTALYGRAADRIGIRFTLTLGVLLMTFGALLGAVSQSFAVLIMARAIQGAGAASVPVLAVALISARYQGDVRDRGLTRMTGAAVTVGATGPLMGGLLEASAGWRAAMCLPALGILMVVALWGVSPFERDKVHVDLIGAVLVMLTAGATVVLVQSASSGLTLLAIGGLLFTLSTPLLIARVRTRPDGFIPLRLVTTPGLLRIAVTSSLVVAAWLALLVTIPAHLGSRGWAPLWIGVALLPSAIPGILGPFYATKVISRLGSSRSVHVAASISVVALLVGAAGARWSPVLLISAMFIANMGWGLGQPAMTSDIAGRVTPALRNQALGLATLIFFVGGGIGSAIGGLGGTWGFHLSLLALAVLALAILSISTAHRWKETR